MKKWQKDSDKNRSSRSYADEFIGKLLEKDPSGIPERV